MSKHRADIDANKVSIDALTTNLGLTDKGLKELKTNFEA